MKEFIEKLIGRLEEERKKQQYLFNNVLNNEHQRMIHEYAEQCYLYMTDIVNQLAEEYNNDYCEWKKKTIAEIDLIREPHRMYLFSASDDEWKYCPYCGKKIKVVEPKGE